MRRWIVGSFIVAYLSALGFGLGCQTLRMGTTMHPAMYFIVWDMYCGWAAYNHGYRAIAEGVSGTYYDLNPPPWGAFRPFDTLDRFQSIMPTNSQAKMAAHFAAHSKHEPLSRLFVIEESWAKQFDLPEYIWKAHNAIPRTPHRYAKLAIELAGDGSVTQFHTPWLETQMQMMIADNPRLQHEVRNSKPFHLIDEHQRDGNRYFNGAEPNTMQIISSPSAD